MFRILKFLFPALLLLTAACRENENDPYLEFTGGGFIFNYRVGEAFYGFVAKPLRTIPDGTKIIAHFEDPAGGPDIEVIKTGQSNIIQYSFRTPGVKQVVKDQPYRVVVMLMDPQSGKKLGQYETTFSSNLDQTELPDGPLTIGPGYHRHPDSKGKL